MAGLGAKSMLKLEPSAEASEVQRVQCHLGHYCINSITWVAAWLFPMNKVFPYAQKIATSCKNLLF